MSGVSILPLSITSNLFPEIIRRLFCRMARWSFLTNHARVLVCIAHDPGVRLRDIAATLDITERSAYGIVTELVEAGYVIKDKTGRRNRYHVQGDLPLGEPIGRERTIGEVLELLVETNPSNESPRVQLATMMGCSTPLRGLTGSGITTMVADTPRLEVRKGWDGLGAPWASDIM